MLAALGARAADSGKGKAVTAATVQAETVAPGQRQSFPEFLPGDGSIQGRMLLRTIAGTVLVHEIEIGCGRDLVCEEVEDLLGLRQAPRQHQMTHQQAAPGDSVLVEN
jgi:hypothetical protein